MCPHCRAFITASDKVCPYCNERVGPRSVERQGSSQEFLAGFIPQAHFTTVIILLINFGLYAATAIYSQKSGHGSLFDVDIQTLRDFGAKFFPQGYVPQWWRLVTAGFLHKGVFHILMNSWALFDLGASVEEAYGTARMLVIYVVSSIAGFYFSMLWNPDVTSIGASAAICGLLGAMLALGLKDRSSMGDAMRGMYVRWLVFIMIISLFGGVDMAAHVGGVAGGFVVGYVAGQPGRIRSPLETLWKIGAWLSVVMTLGSFGLWFVWFMKSGS